METVEQHLSTELKVACEIWHFNALDVPIWLTKLALALEWCMNRQQVCVALDTLTDWMIIYGEYGPTENGRAGYCYHVDTHDGGDYRIRDLYEQYWKEERKANINPGTTFIEENFR